MSARPEAALGQLPTELLVEICSQLPDRRDLHALTLVCRGCNEVATEVLYQSYEYIHSTRTPDKALWPFLDTIQRKRHLAQLVKSIRIDERAYTPWKTNAPDIFRAVCSLEDECMWTLFRKILKDMGDGDLWNLGYRFRLDGPSSLSSLSGRPSPLVTNDEESFHSGTFSLTSGDSGLFGEESAEGNESYADQGSEHDEELRCNSAEAPSDEQVSDDSLNHDDQLGVQLAVQDHGARSEDGQPEIQGMSVEPADKLASSGNPRRFWDYLGRDNDASNTDASEKDLSRRDEVVSKETDPEKPYRGRSLAEIVFWIQARLEDLQLRAQSALLLVLCPNLEELHINLSSSVIRNSPAYVLQPLIAAGARDLRRSFHGFSSLTALTLDLSAFAPTRYYNVTPLHETELFSILCIPSLRRATLVFAIIEDHRELRYKRLLPDAGSLSKLKSSVTDLTLIRPYSDIRRLIRFFTWLAPPLVTLRVQECAPSYWGEGRIIHDLGFDYMYSVLAYQNNYHASLNQQTSRVQLQEAYLDLVDTWLVMRWYLILDERSMFEMDAAFPGIGLWSAHSCLTKLTIVLVPLRRFLDPDWQHPDWAETQVWTHANIARAALRLTHVFPESLEYLVLLVDPQWQYYKGKYGEFADPDADGLFDDGEPRHACRGTSWCKATWSLIWGLAASYPHFSNLKCVALEFIRVETCVIEQPVTMPPIPRSGTQIVVWPPASGS